MVSLVQRMISLQMTMMIFFHRSNPLISDLGGGDAAAFYIKGGALDG